MSQPIPPSPPPPRVSLAAMLRLRPGPWRLAFAVRSAAAMGGCALTGWLLGDQAAGLTATLGAFTALYGSGRPFLHRAGLLAAIAVGLAACVALGVLTAAVASPWPGVFAAALIALVASFLCSALLVGPPGAYLFTLACAAATNMHGHGGDVGRIALLVLAGGAVAWALQMAGALWRPRGPEERAVAAAAAAVADYIEASAHGPADMQRHATAIILHETWLTLAARQPAGLRKDGRLHRLRALSRELHRLFGEAIATAGQPGRDKDAAAAARAIGASARNPPPVGAADALYRPLAFIRPSEALALSLRPGAPPLRIALRVGAAALLAGGLVVAAGLGRGYWAVAAAVLMLYQGLDWTRSLQRGLERTLGTFTGLGLAAALLLLRPQGPALAALVAALQFVIEIIVMRNYALATVFITPIALVIAEAAAPSTDLGLLLFDRGFDTLVGCVVGLAVLFATSRGRRPGAGLRLSIDATVAAARALPPALAAGAVTDDSVRLARTRLRNCAVDMLQRYDEQSGSSEAARAEADRFWPAVIAAQRLAFRLLAAAWEIEAAGGKPISFDDARRLDDELGRIHAGADAAGDPPTAFLRAEIDALRAALQRAESVTSAARPTG